MKTTIRRMLCTATGIWLAASPLQASEPVRGASPAPSETPTSESVQVPDSSASGSRLDSGIRLVMNMFTLPLALLRREAVAGVHDGEVWVDAGIGAPPAEPTALEQAKLEVARRARDAARTDASVEVSP